MIARDNVTTIGDDDGGKTALDLLATRFTYHDRQEWLGEFREQRLTVNDETATPGTILNPGDRLRYTPEPRPEPPVDMTSALLCDKGDFCVISKSGNLPCHPAGCFFNHTLWAQLKEGTIPGLPPRDRIHFVSRLDRETSGIVLVAWSAEALRQLNRALASPGARKIYRVLVQGDFPTELRASGWLWTPPDSPIRKRRVFTREIPPECAVRPETAATRFRLIARRGDVSELEAILETGRTHQIRATLASLGYPVLGDKLYGVDPTIFLRFIAGAVTAEDRSRLRLARQALHAYRLILPLPGQEQPMECLAPIPEDMRLENPALDRP